MMTIAEIRKEIRVLYTKRDRCLRMSEQIPNPWRTASVSVGDQLIRLNELREQAEKIAEVITQRMNEIAEGK